jgi:hypothetical protein
MTTESAETSRVKAAELASRVLAGITSPILAARQLSGLLLTLGCDLEDPDYRTFVGIDSETDALPVGKARQHWAPEALAEKAPDIDRAEKWALDFGREAFANVIARFGTAV